MSLEWHRTNEDCFVWRTSGRAPNKAVVIHRGDGDVWGVQYWNFPNSPDWVVVEGRFNFKTAKELAWELAIEVVERGL